MLKALLKRFGFIPKKDMDDVIEEYQNREIYNSEFKHDVVKKSMRQNKIVHDTESGIISNSEDDEFGSVNLNNIDPDEFGSVNLNNIDSDEFGSVNLNNIDPDELLSDKIFEGLCTQIPEGWFVFEAGQSPLHMLWYCQLIDFESMYSNDECDVQDSVEASDVRRVFSEKKNTLTEALHECIRNIELEDYI